MGHDNKKAKKKLSMKHNLILESIDIIVEENLEIDFINETLDFMEITAIIADSHIKEKELIEN